MKPESAFNFDQNQCSDWIRIGVQVGPEYANQALKEYLEHHAWQIEKINQGLAAADRGELIAHDDVMSEMEDLIASKAKGTE